MRIYKMGVVGFAHMHVTSLVRDFMSADGRVEFVGGADLPPDAPTLSDQSSTRGHNARVVSERTSMPLLSSLEEVLDRKPDICIVCCENARHGEVVSKILMRGVHVVMEKPMAANMAGAWSIARAAELSGSRVFVNWPSTWFPAVRTAQALVASGAIGRPFRFHYRNYASGGPFSYGQTLTPLEKSAEWWHRDAPGGGAALDYCCYGACLSRWFLGEDPVSAYGLRANFNHLYTSADDYGTITAQFRQAVAIIEGSWTTVHPGGPNGPVVLGLDGTVSVDQSDKSRVMLYTGDHGKDARAVPADPLPEGRDNIGREVIHCLDTGDSPHPTLDLPVNLGAMMMLDAGIRSSRSGRMEPAATRTYTFGE